MTGDRSNKDPKGRDAIQEITRRLGSIVDAVEDAIQSGGTGEGGRDFSIDSPHGPVNGRYGITIKSATARGRPGPPNAGRRKAADEPSTSPASREPMIDTFDEPDEFIVTADIPGLQLADVGASCETGQLVLTIAGDTPLTRRFTFAALTPEHHPGIRVSNGILEIRIVKLKFY